jgi:hypothetical protein
MDFARGSRAGSLDARRNEREESRGKKGRIRTSHGEQAPLEAETESAVKQRAWREGDAGVEQEKGEDWELWRCHDFDRQKCSL